MHEKSLIVLSGLSDYTPVELEYSDISKFTTTVPIPDLDQLLRVINLTKSEAITPDPNRVERVRNITLIMMTTLNTTLVISMRKK